MEEIENNKESKNKKEGVHKRTILTYGDNGSYMEENDSTYEFNGTSVISENEITEASWIEDSGIHEIINSEKGEKRKSDLKIDNDIKKTIVEIFENKIKKQKFLNKHEILRKVLHGFIGVITLWIYTKGVSHKKVLRPLIILFFILFANDYIRFRNNKYNIKVVKLMWFLMRKNEIFEYNGAIWFLLGLIVVFIFFPKDICILSVLFLSWGDTAAAVIGKFFSKYNIKLMRNKTLIGVLSSFVVGSLSSYMFYAYFIPKYSHVNTFNDITWSVETSKLSLYNFALICGLVCSFSEAFNFFSIDDNFTIPILSSIAIYSVSRYFLFK